jgi:hypothetical protein
MPSASMRKHGMPHCADGVAENQSDWHVLVVDLRFEMSGAQCSGAQGVACATRGSASLPYTQLSEAIGEAMRTGADLLLLSDISVPVTFPAGLAVHGTGSPLVAQYYPQYYAGHTGAAITVLSAPVSVVSSGGSGVGGAPTVLSGLRLSSPTTLDGHFGSGVWLVNNVLEAEIQGEQVTGHVVVSRCLVSADDLLLVNTDSSWMPAPNTTVSMTVDCNLFSGGNIDVVTGFTSGNQMASVFADVHDNYFAAGQSADCSVSGAARVHQRIARNFFDSMGSLTADSAAVDEDVFLIGQNIFGSSSFSFSIDRDAEVIHSSTYANLFNGNDWDPIFTATGQQGMLITHQDNKHLQNGPTPYTTINVYFSPTALDKDAAPQAALVFERNQLPYSASSGYAMASLQRSLPAGASDVSMLLSTESNFVRSSSPGYRVAQLTLDTASGLAANHLSAVHSQGDWLSEVSGARLYRQDNSGDMVASTYSMEVKRVIGYQIGNVADMYVSPGYTSYGCTFAFHVEDNTAVQQNGFSSAIATFVLPSTMVGGQTEVYIARNYFSTDSAKKRSSFVATRCKRSASTALRCDSSYTSVATSAAYGPYLGGGAKKRSIAVPYTVPYLGGLTLQEGAHHSFRFVENQVEMPGSSNAAVINTYEFEFGALLPGAVVVEAHVDRNQFVTTGAGGSSVVYVYHNRARFGQGATAALLESTVDNNVFRSDPSGVAQPVYMSADPIYLESGSAASLRQSASYNSVGTFRNGYNAIFVSGRLSAENGVTASTTHDVYRLNYDCELRGNQFLREQGAGPLGASFVNVYAGTVSSGQFVSPVQAYHSVVLDDNHFNAHCDATGSDLLYQESFFYMATAREGRSSMLQRAHARGNYAPEGVVANAFLNSYSRLYSNNIRTLQFRADLSNNKAPAMSRNGIRLICNHYGGGIPLLKRDVTVESNELGLCGDYTVYARAGGGTYQRGNARIANNRILGSQSVSPSRAVDIRGHNVVELAGNQLLGMDETTNTLSDAFYVRTNAYRHPTQVSITDNVLRNVEVSSNAFNVYTNTAATTNTFSFENNLFRRVSGSANGLFADTSAPNGVCGYFTGNSFVYSSASMPYVQASNPFYYAQVAPDGMDLSGVTACP